MSDSIIPVPATPRTMLEATWQYAFMLGHDGINGSPVTPLLQDTIKAEFVARMLALSAWEDPHTVTGVYAEGKQVGPPSAPDWRERTR